MKRQPRIEWTAATRALREVESGERAPGRGGLLPGTCEFCGAKLELDESSIPWRIVVIHDKRCRALFLAAPEGGTR